MQRRKFSREFKLEAVKLVLERGVSAAQTARDLDVQANSASCAYTDPKHACEPSSQPP